MTDFSKKIFADGVRSWGPHADVPAPLKVMGENCKLVILSNADDSFLAESVPRLGAEFHAVFTAEQAGFYKPRYGAFEYMLDQLDAQPEDFVHVSSHTRYDLKPAHDLGFRNSIFVDRGYDPPAPSYEYIRVETLDELNTMLGLRRVARRTGETPCPHLSSHEPATRAGAWGACPRSACVRDLVWHWGDL